LNLKMIIINNPNNPTGIPIPSPTLSAIVEFARSRGIIVFSDEVYRPLFHRMMEDPDSVPPPITALSYDNVITTGSMSKAYALAGIRIGWIASRNKTIINQIASARDYNTISVSQIDDQIASYALSDAVLMPLLERNIKLANRNLNLLSDFVDRHSSVCSWVKPTAGTTAFIQFTSGGDPVNDVEFCIDILDKTRVLFVPGSKCFGGGQDFVGYVRVGYVCHTSVLEEALERLSTYVESYLTKV
jgi:aspartate/methionine/tyrosine aminotransferase